MTKKFEDEYKAIYPILNKALAELKRLIKAQLRKINDPCLVRIRLTEARVKSIKSLLSKATKKIGKGRIFSNMHEISLECESYVQILKTFAV